MYQMQKIRIEIKTKIPAHTNTGKATQLIVDNWRNKTTDIADSNREA